MMQRNIFNCPDDFCFLKDARRLFSRIARGFHHKRSDDTVLIHKALDKMGHVRGQIISEPDEIQEFIYENEILIEKRKSVPDSYYVRLLEIQLHCVQERIIPPAKSVSGMDDTEKGGGMTSGQLVLFFYYVLDALGVNFGNSDKAQWLRLMQCVTGKNYDNLKKKLNFNFDNPQTRKDMRYVKECLMELLPSIGVKIENDSRIQE